MAILIIATGLLIVVNLTSLFEQYRTSITTFWVSFLVGMGGASVYLILLLMTEKNLAILQNDLINDVYLMSILFILSGGFVAAITQTTTGAITVSSLQGVFMIGFGWQGALAGVASSGTRIKLMEDYREESEFNSENANTILAAKNRKILELTEAVKEMAEKPPASGGG